jgi:chitinase
LLDSPADPARGQGLAIDLTIDGYLKAGVPAHKLVLGIPACGRGWAGVPHSNHGLYQSSTGAAPSPSGDTLQTDGTATYRTLKTFGADGFTAHYDLSALAVCLYNPSTEIFWTFDDTSTVLVKMVYAKLRAGGLGGAFEWALKDDDENAALLKTISKRLDSMP